MSACHRGEGYDRLSDYSLSHLHASLRDLQGLVEGIPRYQDPGQLQVKSWRLRIPNVVTVCQASEPCLTMTTGCPHHVGRFVTLQHVQCMIQGRLCLLQRLQLLSSSSRD